MKKIVGIPENMLQDIKQLFTDTDIQEFSASDNESSISIIRKQKIQVMDLPLQSINHANLHAASPSDNISIPPPMEVTKLDSYSDSTVYHKVKSPIMGTFYTTPSPDSPPFVEIGSKIAAGATICVIEAMKMFNEIKSQTSGTVVAILKKKGDGVSVEDVLVIIEKE